jgi:hypothetical protein
VARPGGVQLAIIFGVWTLIGLASGFDAYLSGVYVGRIRSLWQYFYAPLMEQWTWAALTPAVFVRIQERRFDRLLTSVFDVAPEALDAAVPTLLLQPHVENAVVHGVALRVEPGRVEVRAARWDDKLVLQVIDNGAALAEGYHEGIGLSNTRARLRQLYGSEQSFELSNAPGGGVMVRIVLPFRIAPPDSEGESHDEDSDSYRGRRSGGHPKGSAPIRRSSNRALGRRLRTPRDPTHPI